MCLANRIRDLREKAFMTQVELAHCANLTQGYISEVERGLRYCSPGGAARIAAALGVEVEALGLKEGN